MAARFKVGDTVGWNSEAGNKIIKVHTKDFKYKGIHTTPRKMIRNMKLKAVNLII